MNTIIDLGESESIGISHHGVQVQIVYLRGFIRIVQRLDRDTANILALGIDCVLNGAHDRYGVLIGASDAIVIISDEHGFAFSIRTKYGTWQRRVSADTLRAIDCALDAAVDAALIADHRQRFTSRPAA